MAPLVAPFLSGAALWLSFPPFSLYPLAWVALIPYLLFLLEKPSWKQVILGNFVLGAAYFGGVLYWIPRVVNIYGGLRWPLAMAVFALLVLALSFFLLPFSALVRWTAGRSNLSTLACAPGFWILAELCRNYYAVNGFPWALLGYSQYAYSLLSQTADLGGVYLVSFLIVMGNCAVLAVFRFRAWRRLAYTVVALGVANLYGVYRIYVWKPQEEGRVRVALVQPNIALYEGRQYYAKKYFEDLPSRYRQAAQAGAQWVIFPEAQNPYSYPHDFYFRTFWERQVKTSTVSLLLNSTSFEEGASARYFNSAILLNTDGRLVYRYDKVHLVPFGEYVPLPGWLGFAEPLVQEVGAFSPGDSFDVGAVSETRFGTLICYEGIFPEISRRFVEEGAQVLVNITNDSWYGRSAAPRQHLIQAAFRAIEMRKPLLRCANSGHSAVIDPLGRTQQELGLFEEGTLYAEVAGNSYRSLYSYWGEWPAVAIIMISFAPALVRRKGR